MVLKATDYRPGGDNLDFYRTAIQEPTPEWFKAFPDAYVDDGRGESTPVTLGKYATAYDIVLFGPMYLSLGGGVLSHQEIATKRRAEGDPGSLNTRIPTALVRAAELDMTILGLPGQDLMTDAGHFTIDPDNNNITLSGYSGTFGPGDPEGRELTVKAIRAALPNIDVILKEGL